MGTDLYGPTMIEVRSGIRLHSESGATATVLDAQEQGRVLVCKFCAGIDGFTITGGRTLRDYLGGYGGIGGGIFALGGQPVFADNIIAVNFAEESGGGIDVHAGRSPGASSVIRFNSVLWNAAGYRTGGIELGGGDAAVVENNTVAGNLGGGIACMGCKATIARNIIAEKGSPATIHYTVEPGTQTVALTVYDLAGRVVARILDGAVTAHEGSITWNGRDRAGAPVSAGVYLVRLETATGSVTQKLAWIR
jgi:hypothetical protein